jgi:site-specific DNA-methyltransferase (adenine-specific)
MQIEDRALDTITLYENNPRRNDRAVEAVTASIREFGFKVPIVVDRKGVIVTGHTRYKAAQKLGIPTVPVIVADDLTPEQIQAFRLADNKVGEIATWNEEMLAEELNTIAGIDMRELGFTDKDFEELLLPKEDEYTLPDGGIAEDTRTHEGELWQLGEHRLFVGDATKPEDLEKLMRGEKARLLVIDPPYNVDYDEKEQSLLAYRPNKRAQANVLTGIKNDKMESGIFRLFLEDAFSCADKVMEKGAAFYIWHADNEGYNFRGACIDTGWKIRQCLVWVKNHIVIGRQDYQWKHEVCLYGWKEGAEHYFTFDRTQVGVFEEKDLNRMSRKELIAELQRLREGESPTTVIRHPKPMRSEDHPTMKPVPLIGKLISNSSRSGELVLDTFAGSGSTLIAAHQLGRRCYCMEIDPKYADVILTRWEALTEREAVRIG